MKHYLDYNATAPVRSEVFDVMQELQSFPLNPSSVHAHGRKAKNILDNARRTIAEITGAFANEVVFTASGTEANNWAIRAFSNRQIFLSAIEHSSVLKTAHAVAKPLIIPVTGNGIVDMDALAEILPKEGNFIASVMLANNETGVIQPVREIADMVHKNGGMLHCDAVQAFGKIPVDFTHIACDLMTISAHKMGGPVGVAALVVKNNLPLPPLLTGGGQELNRRAGTENIAAIAGFSKASELIDFEQMKNLRQWLDRFEDEITAVARVRGGVLHDAPAGESERSSDGGSTPPKIISKNSPRLPNTSCVTMPGVTSETQLISFDLEGIAVSAGSACSSGRIEPSHVLKAMGISSGETATAIRISSGWATTENDIIAATNAWKKLFYRKSKAP